MDIKLLDHLSCPFCGEDIVVTKILQQKKSVLFYGLLTCSECSTHYPVVEGIPIMMPSEKRVDVFDQTTKRKSLSKNRISISEISAALENDEIEKVKEALVYSIPYTLYTLPKYADAFGNFGKRVARKIMRSSYLDRTWIKYTKNILENDSTTFREALKAYYQDHDYFNYFFYKFGQPRFLTTLGLASMIDSSQQPVLDLACGQGHLIHFLIQKDIGSMAVGVDRNFCQLILAQKYIAPQGQFICAEADEKLPFRKDTFGGIICSDAFHCFKNKISCIRDLKEIITEKGTIILNRVGNKSVPPNEGSELTPTGYLKLFNSMPAKMIGENYLIESYLNKRKPNLSQLNDISYFKDQKWLTVVASNNEQIFKDHGHFEEWPHSVGTLALNPLYKKTGSDSEGNEHYKFTYPSDWYKFEDSLWENYAREEVTISKDVLNALDEDQRDSVVNKYIDEFVLLGFPKNYM